MIADLGQAALLLALVTCAYSIAAFLMARDSSSRLLQSARNGMYAVFWLVTLTSALLLAALLSRDYQLSYVASYASNSASLPYTIAAFWAGNAGSLLLWSWVLALSGVIMMRQCSEQGAGFSRHASATVLATQALFVSLMLFTANPFDKLATSPTDGQGLNPLLENPGMIFHPTTLLAGYASLTIPFALTVAAMLTNRLDERWLRYTRKWTLVSWFLLGVGNVLGMQWAYVELGWGGYWAWDPVENAGLMPWLTATALLHSLTVQRRLGSFRVWNVSLVGASFLLSIFGTFLTRSNVLSSVHTFGESGQEPFFLFFMTLWAVLYLALVLTRVPALSPRRRVNNIISRETSFLLNNIILVLATAIIFLGTMFPLFSQVAGGPTASVDASFFNAVVVPVLVVVVLLMGICPVVAWFHMSPGKLADKLLPPTYAALGAAIIPVLLSLGGVVPLKPYAVIAFAISAFVVASVFQEWTTGTLARHRVRGEGYLRAFASLIGTSRSRYGGYVVHLGIVLMAIGITGSSAYGVSREFTLSPGQSAQLGQYRLTYEGLTESDTGTQQVVTASLKVANGTADAGGLTAKRYFKANFNPVSEIGLRTGPVEDLYVILMGWDENGLAAFKVLVNPLVLWIWVGGGLLLLGSVIALWPERQGETEAGR